MWQQHFEDLLGKPPLTSDELITPIITEELNIKKGPFIMDALKKAVSCIQNDKACGFDETPVEVWKLNAYHQILLDLCNSVYNQDPVV